MYKSSHEVTLMKRAIKASADAHQAALEQTRPGMREYEIEAILEYHFRRNGAEGPAYPSIVASGTNATVLHYISNNQYMNDGDLLLIDAGSEYGCYCSDVTRTFPIGRRFSAPQRDIYSLVLAAQEDDVLVTESGHEVLTDSIIKDMDDLESVRGTI